MPETEFKIVPYRSVGAIRFGFSLSEVNEETGAPISVTRNNEGELDYQYDEFSIRLSAKDEKVVEVGLVPPAVVRLDGIEIFRSPSAFEQLIARDGAPYEFYGFIVLLNLGITLTGFHDDDESQIAVTAFERGRWDELRSELRPFTASAGS